MQTKISALLCYCLGVATMNGCGARSVEPAGLPRISFEKSAWDLGDIPVDRDHPYTVRIPLTNYGNGELKIERIRLSCGCAGARIDGTSVAPGQKAVVTVDITRSSPERRVATLVVFSNDPNSPESQLQFSWHAVGAIEFDPPSLDLGTILSGESFTTIRIGQNRGGRAEVALRVHWQVRQLIDVSPRSLMLRPGRPGERRSQHLTVSATGGAELRLEKVELDESSVAAAWSSKKIGESAVLIYLESTLPDSPGVHRFTVKLRCSEPVPKDISVPVVAYVLEDAARGEP